MQSNFGLFGPMHLGILAAVPLLAAILAWLDRHAAFNREGLRLVLAAALIVNAVVWYGYLAFRGWLQFPENLPLELCDGALFVTVIALTTRNALSFDLAYYVALAGTTMALLTPDLWEPFPSFSTVQFFIAHGLVVVAVLYLVWSRRARPRRGSIWRAMLGVNLFAAIAGLFNVAFGTNYMYLGGKPQNPSLLDFLGPWPWYLASCEVLALVLFSLLYLPFRSTIFMNGAPEDR
jgi:hypothetical integral membrane protein (TIGR02206 family)